MGTRIKKEKIEAIKEALKVGVPVVSAGIAGTKLVLDQRNKKKERELTKKRTESLEKLAENIEKLENSMRKSRKTFSVRGNNSKPRDFKKPFGFIGLDSDFAKNWLLEKAKDTMMGFTSYNTEDFLYEFEEEVSINKDLKRHSVNLLFYNGVLEMLFVNPRRNEISKIDRILDNYCDKYEKETGYIATQPGNNIFHVELKTKEGTEIEIPEEFIENNLSINVLK